MLNASRPCVRMVLPAILVMALSACGGSGEQANGSSEAADQPAAAAVAPVDACTFIPKAELEKLVGYELRDGDSQDVAPGQSQCDFEKPAGMYVTRTFENPALPEAAGFSSIVVTTYPTTAKTFADGRQLLGEGANNVTEVGESAYLIGPNLMHVRKGNRGFSVRVYVEEPRTDAGRETLRRVMISLGQAGAAKL